MAKKRKAKEEKKEEPEFEFPEFDEVEFMRHENRDTKANVIAFGFAIIMVIATYFVGRYVSLAVGFIIGLGGMAGLKFLFDFVKLNLDEFKIKEWLGVIAVYFFTWLGLWILLVNPPFSDFSAPSISLASAPVLEARVDTGGNMSFDHIQIEFRITDNYHVDHATIVFTEPANFQRDPVPLAKGSGRNLYVYTNPGLRTGNYAFTVTAVDSYGNEKRYSSTLEIVNGSVPEVSASSDPRDPSVITVWVTENGLLESVWYVENGTDEKVQVTIEKKPTPNSYKASISTVKWTGAKTVTIYAKDNAGNIGSTVFIWSASG